MRGRIAILGLLGFAAAVSPPAPARADDPAFLTVAGVSNGMSFVGGGVLIDVYFGNRFVVTPSFAPTWWRGKTDELDLGHGLEFRSQIEFAYRFDDRSRLGLAVSHSSNASLGDTNPGTETLMLNYSFPLGAPRR